MLLYVPSQQLFIALCLFELCFTLRFVFLVSCNPYCSVALTHGAMGWSAVCDCDYPCLRSNWRIQGGGGGSETTFLPGKSQDAICFLRNTGTDSTPTPIPTSSEKQLGHITSLVRSVRPSMKHVDEHKSQDPPPSTTSTEFSGSANGTL